jgi:hypothetical protein
MRRLRLSRKSFPNNGLRRLSGYADYPALAVGAERMAAHANHSGLTVATADF